MAGSAKPMVQTRADARPLTRRILVGAALALTAVFIIAPVVVVFDQAFAKGWSVFVDSLVHPEMQHAIFLTVLTAVVVVPINIVFGVAAAWAITKFSFRGKKALIALIEIPFSISPIVAGVCYLFLYGAQGLFGGWLMDHGIQIMFSVTAIILVTMFVTSPFVARELIPLMQVQGRDQEEAAATLGANGWQIFRRVTLPNVKWALLYGAVLCNARAMGEFGAVSVVSGNIRGATNTLPLHVEVLYHSYNAPAAFTAAAVLTVLALLTLVLKASVENRAKH
jgi:sulfate transport system permease protein